MCKDSDYKEECALKQAKRETSGLIGTKFCKKSAESNRLSLVFLKDLF